MDSARISRPGVGGRRDLDRSNLDALERPITDDGRGPLTEEGCASWAERDPSRLQIDPKRASAWARSSHSPGELSTGPRVKRNATDASRRAAAARHRKAKKH